MAGCGCCAPCSEIVGITFHEVVIPQCCNIDQTTISEVVFNDSTVSFLIITGTNTCDCYYDYTRVLSGGLSVFEVAYDNPDCTSPNAEGTLGIQIFITKEAGIWYVLAVDPAGHALFIGSGADPSHIDNTISCGELIDYSWLDCTEGGSVFYAGAANGGYAVIA